MSLTLCPICHRSKNVAICCGRDTLIDERFPAEWPEEHVYSVRRHRIQMKRALRRKRFGPLSIESLEMLSEHLACAIAWTGESRDERAKEIRALLTEAREKLFKTRSSRVAGQLEVI